MNEGRTQVSIETTQPVRRHELRRPGWDLFSTSLEVALGVTWSDGSKSKE